MNQKGLEEFLGQVIVGDAREHVSLLPQESIQCVITSPPYFGLRNYSDAENPLELGREVNLQGYISRLRDLFRQVRRALRNDGTLWLNLGDTYRDGQMLSVPWRVALSLQEDGWKLRADIIWHKQNAMPSSVKSRPTIDHEYVFLFSKSEQYYYDADAIREPHVTFSADSKRKGGRRHLGLRNGTPEEGKNSGNSNLHNGRWDQAFHPLGRNKRSVWSLPLGKCREAHFAVFPEALVEPCVKAGAPEGGVIMDPFTGSGTTGIVCRRLRRRFVGIELLPKYAEIAERRIHAATPEPTLFDAPSQQSPKADLNGTGVIPFGTPAGS
jgi:site-specific DNA-methyltransferase (adenine-specific)